MNIIYEYLDPIEFNVAYALKSMSITKTDIIDAVLIIRPPNTEDATDESAPVKIVLNSGLSWDARETSLLARIPIDQWANLTVGSKYEWRIGIKVNGAANYSELETNPNNIVIVQDFIRG